MRLGTRVPSRMLVVVLACAMAGPVVPARALSGDDLQTFGDGMTSAGITATTAPIETTPSLAETYPVAAGPVPSDEATTSQVETPTVSYVRMQEDHPWVKYAGRWYYRSSVTSSGRSVRYSRTPGVSSVIRFSGTRVRIVGPKGVSMGRASVYLDGVRVGTVSQYGSIYQAKQVLWDSGTLSDAGHTLKVIVQGTHDASSTASWVYVDAFDIAGSRAKVGPYVGAWAQENSSLIHRAPSSAWTRAARGTTYGGHAMHASASGASVTVRFKGSAITWFGRKSPQGGLSEVWLDGRKMGIVSQYSSSTVEPRASWAISGLADTTHSLKITCLGRPEVVQGGKRTEIDAFLASRSVVFAPRPTPFSYPWKTYIVIDKSQYKLYWVKDKVLRKVYPIAHGKSSTPTPSRVWRIDAKYHTDPSGVYGPRKMRLFKRVWTSSGYRYVFTRYGIHGTNEPWVIGTKASHGCIRMYNKDALELYPQVPLHTMVVTRD